MSAIGSHHSARMLEDRWLTPKYIIDALGGWESFALDPCAAPEPRTWPTAQRHITRPDDGLSVPWEGRVYVNPPYGPNVGRWLSRLAGHGHGTALVFARTETSWAWEHVWQRATAVLLLEGRIYFCRPDGQAAKANAGAPSMLAAYGEDDAERLEASGLSGAFIRDWSLTGDNVPGRQAPLFGGAA